MGILKRIFWFLVYWVGWFIGIYGVMWFFEIDELSQYWRLWRLLEIIGAPYLAYGSLKEKIREDKMESEIAAETAQKENADAENSKVYQGTTTTSREGQYESAAVEYSSSEPPVPETGSVSQTSLRSWDTEPSVDSFTAPPPANKDVGTSGIVNPVLDGAQSLKIAPEDMINLNTASRQELEGLAGINFIMARKIISVREQEGPFVSLEDFFNRVTVTPHLAELIKKQCFIENKSRIIDY